MKQILNSLGQPIGFEVKGWNGASPPDRTPIKGKSCSLVPVDPQNHRRSLFESYNIDEEGGLWTYLPVGPFKAEDEIEIWLVELSKSEDPMFFTIVDNSTGKAVGVVSFLRFVPEMGVIEVGFITYSPLLQRTVMATETMYLMMARVFDDWGYRRYEWKCDALNTPSRNSAERLGFTYEGIFRQAVIYKGRNRDTAWFSIIDREWPMIKTGFQNWLSPENFDEKGNQKEKLRDLIDREKAKG